ncbi:GroES-like protein [Trametes sanguinea]|nr:GroES-like protein [Trametes sanguinea]
MPVGMDPLLARAIQLAHVMSISEMRDPRRSLQVSNGIRGQSRRAVLTSPSVDILNMSALTTQKALLLLQESTPYVVGERPVPHPGPKEVLVKIIACALNPLDYRIADPPYSRWFIKSWPYVPGHDAAGIVVQVGAEVVALKEGDRVMFEANMDRPDGAACQQYATVDADLTAIIPANISFEQAASIPLALTTDVMLLYNQSPAPENLGLRLKPVWEPEGTTAYAGTPAFIIGGATSLGQYAIQLAKLAGHNPIITTASPHNAELLTSLGAAHVLDRTRSNESILDELPKLTAGRPIQFAFVAAPFDPAACRLGRDALAPGGALGIVLPSPTRVPEDVANAGDGKRVGYVFGSVWRPHTRECGIDMFKHLTEWLEKGVLKPNLVEVLPNGLAGIPDGLERLKANKVSGKKLVAKPQETA